MGRPFPLGELDVIALVRAREHWQELDDNQQAVIERALAPDLTQRLRAVRFVLRGAGVVVAPQPLPLAGGRAAR